MSLYLSAISQLPTNPIISVLFTPSLSIIVKSKLFPVRVLRYKETFKIKIFFIKF
jgi:hypothetical protein